MNKGLNRIKVVLAEQEKTNRWLANELQIGEATVSKWCTNKSQPSLETLANIHDNLAVSPAPLLGGSKVLQKPQFLKIQRS